MISNKNGIVRRLRPVGRRFGTAIVFADAGIGISDLVFPKNDVTFV